MKDVLAFVFLAPFIAMALGVCVLVIKFVLSVIKDK